MALVYITSFIDFSIGGEDLEEISKAFPEHRIVRGSAKEIGPEIKDDIEIVFGYVNPGVLSGMKSLKWIHLPWAGVEPFLGMEEIKSGKLLLTNARGVYGPPISEYILGMFLSLKHNLHLHRDEQHEEVWNPRTPALEFAGSTVGILGFGDIGRTLAKKCSALGAKVTAVKNTPAEKPDYVDELYTVDSIDEVLPKLI
jgi:phosphoglycerate dehydrogenase-like enzyme